MAYMTLCKVKSDSVAVSNLLGVFMSSRLKKGSGMVHTELLPSMALIDYSSQ